MRIYDLKQTDVLAFDNLVKNLSIHGHIPIPRTIGIWEHAIRKIKFCLCVDDFGVKYISKPGADHLLNTLGQQYTYTVDWPGQIFCGLNIAWNYDGGCVDVSMPRYIKDVLHDLLPTPTTPVITIFTPCTCLYNRD